MKYKISTALTLLLLTTFIISCNKTNKSALSEGYHDLTAHYNSEWNANDKLRTVLNNVNRNPGDNYDSILNIHAYENAKTTSTYTGDYDLIIKKSTFSIQQHESSKWTDNNFYLMGMAHYMKGDYAKAIDHFQYITSELKEGYKDEFLDKSRLKKKNKKVRAKISKKKAKIKKQKKKGKKVDEDALRPHEKALGPHPSRNPALVMLVLAYVKNLEFAKANSVISYIEADPKFPDNYLADFYLAKATFFIAQSKYEYAVGPLKMGIDELKKKKAKTRATFVLGQLYQVLNQNEEAVKSYENTLALRPDYNMEFNSKLNIAIISASGNGNSKKAKDILSKMSKDGKNAEMLDQIFYHLGKIAFKDNLKDIAIANFRKSIAKNTSNTKQRALTYVALGDVFYEDDEYKLSKMYYDSSLTILNRNASNYAFVKDRDDRLTRLVNQLDIIETEDSLMAIANMPELERKKKLKEIANNLIKLREQNAKNKVEGTSNVNKTEVNDNGNSSFYFYNVTARNRGYNSFKKLWGEVKLTDNWRRQDKVNGSGGSEANADSSDSGNNTSEYRDELKKLQDQIPLTEEQKKMSDAKKIDAYFILAYVYKDDFAKYDEAIATFEGLLKKYPDNKYEAECYYNLYLLYAKNNITKAEQYRELVLTKFPTSLLAQALKDPDFFKKQKTKDQLIDDEYTNAYNQYTAGNYSSSLALSKEAVVKYKGEKMEPKFAYLAALNLGKQRKYDDFKLALSSVIKMYSTDPVKDEAEKMLLYMSNISEYITQDSILNYEKSKIQIVDVVNKTPVKDTDVKPKDLDKGTINTTLKNDTTKLVTKTIDSASTKKDTVIAVKPVDDMPAGMDLSKFIKEEGAIHRVIIYPSNAELASIDLMNKIKAFDLSKPAYKKLLVGNVLLSATTKLITIKEFSNEVDAIAYYNDLLKSDVFKGTSPSDFKIMVCTAKNQSIAVGNGLLDNLYWFFKKNYLK